jgi:hypothetical protein
LRNRARAAKDGPLPGSRRWRIASRSNRRSPR